MKFAGFDDFLHFLPADNSNENRFLRFYHDLESVSPAVRTDRLYLFSTQLESNPSLYPSLPLPLQQEAELAKAVVRGIAVDNFFDPNERLSLLGDVCQSCPLIRTHQKSWKFLAKHKREPECLAWAPPSLLINDEKNENDDDDKKNRKSSFALELCVLNSEWITAMPDVYKKDPEFLRKWIVECADAFQHVCQLDPEVLREHPDLLLLNLHQHGTRAAMRLQRNLPPDLWDSRDVTTLYLEKGGNPDPPMVLHAPHANDQKLWLTHLGAVANLRRPPMLSALPRRLRQDPAFWVKAALVNPLVPQYVDSECQVESWFLDVVLTVAVEHGVHCLDHVAFGIALSKVPPLAMRSGEVLERVQELLERHDTFVRTVLCGMSHMNQKNKKRKMLMDSTTTTRTTTTTSSQKCWLPLLNVDSIQQEIAAYLEIPTGQRLALLRKALPLLERDHEPVAVVEQVEVGSSSWYAGDILEAVVIS